MPKKEVWTMDRLGNAIRAIDTKVSSLETKVDTIDTELDTLASYVMENVATKQELQNFKDEVDDRFDEEHSYNKSMHNAIVDVLEKQAVIPNESAIRIRRF